MATTTFTNGNDTHVVNYAGTHTLHFLAGIDILTIQGGTFTTAYMDDGADIVSLKSGDASVFGGAGADRFEIYTSGIEADGGADNDLFNLRGASTVALAGGLGADRFNFYAGALDVALHGNDGDDDFFGYGNAISGSLNGDAGADYFVGFIGGITIYGGAGNDIYRADATMPANFVEAFGQGTDSVQVARGSSYTLPANIENISVSGFSGSDTTAVAIYNGNSLANTINGHANPEELYGHAGSDRLAGKGGNDKLVGGDGNDSLDGGDGLDWLHGETGNDTLNGRGGDDHMLGGTGNDVYYVDSLTDVITENENEGTDLVRVSANYTMAANIENGYVSGATGRSLTGNDSDNLLVGSIGGDQLRGLAGNDTLNGGAGDDYLVGLTGDDILRGGDGNDEMIGGVGVNTFIGGAGSDLLVGAYEGNTFIYLLISDSLPFAPDTIYYFEASAGGGLDKIDLSAIDANTTVAGDQAFTFTTNPTGATGQLWLSDDGAGNVYINGQVNEDILADFQIHISEGNGTLTAADFVL